MSALIGDKPLVILAYSARYIAQSVLRQGYRPIVLDAFGDSDTLDSCQLHLKVDFSAPEICGQQAHEHMLAIQREYGVGYLLVGTGIEYLLGFLNRLEAWEVLNAPVDRLKRVIDPQCFFRTLDELDIPYPPTRFSLPKTDQTAWVVKPKYGTGGAGIRRWNAAEAVSAENYWQKIIGGVPMSAVFLATPKYRKVLGFNTLWVQWAEDGSVLRYDGAINRAELTREESNKLVAYIDYLIKEFKFVGLGSLDFVKNEDGMFVLEVNPRITGTCELYEPESGEFSLAMEHIRACRHQRVSDLNIQNVVRAYQNVYAENDILIPPDMQWPSWVKDRPISGSRIPNGAPVCSVHASGDERTNTSKLLKRRVKQLINIINCASEKIKE